MRIFTAIIGATLLLVGGAICLLPEADPMVYGPMIGAGAILIYLALPGKR